MLNLTLPLVQHLSQNIRRLSSSPSSVRLTLKFSLRIALSKEAAHSRHWRPKSLLLDAIASHWREVASPILELGLRAKFEVDHSTIMIGNAMLYLMSAAREKQQHRFCTALPVAVDHLFITRGWLNLTRRWVHFAPGSAGAAAVALRSSARRHPWRLCSGVAASRWRRPPAASRWRCTPGR